MSFRYPWEVSSAVHARGGRFQLTGDRTGFYVRGATLTTDERAWIVANRDYALIHIQHLHPPESFLKLKRSGALNIEGRAKR